MSLKKIILSVALLLTGTFFINESLIYSQNNFFLNRYWYPYKIGFFNSYVGAIESFTSRTLLASNRFLTNYNLGSQYIFSQETTNPKEIRYDFRLKKGGYIDLIFNFDESTYEAIRVSRFINYPSSYYKGKISGEFINRTELELDKIDGSTHRATLKNVQGKVVFYLDDKEIYKTNSSFGKSKIGFFSSLSFLEIFNVALTNEFGKVTNMSFSNEQDHKFFFLKNLTIVTAGVLAVYILVFLFYRKNFFSYFLRASAFVFFTAIFWFCYDFFYYSKIPQRWDFDSASFVSPIGHQFDFERYRSYFFNQWYSRLGGIELNNYNIEARGLHYHYTHYRRMCSVKQKCIFVDYEGMSSVKPPNTKRLIYIGGSFSDNSGVTSIDQAFFDKFSLEIIKNYKHKNINLELYNFSFSGGYLSQLIPKVVKIVDKLGVDYVVVGLFANDDEGGLVQLLDALNPKGIITTYIYPTANPEKSYVFLNPKTQQVMITPMDNFLIRLSTDKALRIYRADLLSTYPEFYGKGNLWWDQTHMTAFGQEQFALKNAEFMNTVIK